MVIIVSDHNDLHIPFVIKHLRRPPLVIDLSSIPHKDGLTYSIIGRRSQVIYKDRTLRNVTGVWLRRPSKIPDHMKLPVRLQDQGYCTSAISRLFDQLYVHFPGAVWVSDWYAIQRASAKTLQLKMAADLGFIVPDTIFTSDPERAKRFVAMHSSTIVKPLAQRFPVADRKLVYEFFAHKITTADPMNYDGLHLAPAIFQAAVDQASDIRVTVVGEKVFATKIVERTSQNSNVRDWRAHISIKGLTYTPLELPTRVAKLCVALVKRLGLKFGAIDLVEDIEGQLVFLEINANGQWAFIEEETGQEIGKAIAGLLEG